MNFFHRVGGFLQQNKKIAGAILFFWMLIISLIIQTAPGLADPDSFYHIKTSQQLVTAGPIKDFVYLPLTTLADNYADHHFLYHCLLAPWVIFFSPIAGAKIFQALLAAIAVVVFYFVLIKLETKGAFFWTALLLTAGNFVFRLNLVKAPALSVILLLLIIYFLLKQRPRVLFLLSFLYVWSYGGWFLGLAAVIIYWLVDLCSHYDNWLVAIKNGWRRSSARLVLATMLGSIAGLVVNPYFPQNIKFYFAQIVQIGLFNFQDKIQVGSEWYSPSFTMIILGSGLVLFLSVMAVVIFFAYRRRWSLNVKYLFILFLVFLLATIKARRNAEYLVPSAALFSAAVFTAAHKIPTIWSDCRRCLEQLKELYQLRYLKLFLNTVVLCSLALIVVVLPFNLRLAGKNYTADYLRGPATFLARSSAPGSIVFQPNWDEFPMLFFYNTNNRYISGLDPTFLYLKNKKLAEDLVSLAAGEYSGDIYLEIKNDFGAKYVVVGQRNQKLLNLVRRDNRFREIFSDTSASVYQLD